MKDEEDRTKIDAAHWKRFTLLQRTVKLTSPRGVFRFKTFEEFNEWKARYKPIAQSDLPKNDLL